MVILSKYYILWLFFLLPITLPRHTVAMSIARDGYVFVPTCVDGATLDVLREEADNLFHLKKAQDALSEDEYFDKASTRRQTSSFLLLYFLVSNCRDECNSPTHNGGMHSITRPNTTELSVRVVCHKTSGVERYFLVVAFSSLVVVSGLY